LQETLFFVEKAIEYHHPVTGNGSLPNQPADMEKALKKVVILITSIVPLLAACASPFPELTIYVDTTKCPYLKYERDHAACLERARSLYPVTQIQLRAQPGIYQPVYEAQRAFVIDCLEKMGYRVLKTGEWAPF
jgi:hypothetical protein